MILRADARALPLPDESIDSVVCDPPYGLAFMGKDWDKVDYPWHFDWAEECLRVLKPGAHLVAFGGTRTVHRLACAIEDAGFEIRDTIAWLQWQGFPKSLDVSKAIDSAAVGGNEKKRPTNRTTIGKDQNWGAARSADGKLSYGDYAGQWDITTPATDLAAQWQGWGTALKPAHEPAILARKPLIGTVAQNIAEHGCGALNIDGCRYAYGDSAWPGPQRSEDIINAWVNPNTKGELCSRVVKLAPPYHGDGPAANPLGRYPANIYAVPKASRSEREAGCADLPAIAGHDAVDRKAGTAGLDNPRAGAGRTAESVRNNHPTVKPIALMRWLVRLVTPPGGVCLDPFVGSGTTLCAAAAEGIRAIGIEIDPDYARIAQARSRWWLKYGDASLAESKADVHDREVGQMGLF